jgi:hypothetical protein
MKTLKGHSKNQLENLFRKQMKNGEKRGGGWGRGILAERGFGLQSFVDKVDLLSANTL